jgi:hypothetical protein
MRLAPLTRGTRLFARHTINTGSGGRVLPGQEFSTARTAVSWRRTCMLYEQRRVVSESDPHFAELMTGPGMENNPDFARAWLAGDAPAPTPAPATKATLVDAGGGWYDVVAGGDKLNDKRLRRKDAEEIMEMVNG